MIQEKDPDSKTVENSASHRVALKPAASTSSDYLLEMKNSTESEALEVEQKQCLPMKHTNVILMTTDIVRVTK